MNQKEKTTLRLKLFDSHTHVQFAAFKEDWQAVIQRAIEAGIWLVNVGTQKYTSVRAIEIANQYPEGVYAAVGLHPIHTEKSYHDPQELGIDQQLTTNNRQQIKNTNGFVSRGEDFDYEFYKNLAQDKKVVAIGECGLDFYRLGADHESQITKQKQVFIQQIELAKELNKPLMIHCRQAFSDLIEILKINHQLLNAPAGIMHFFSGNLEEAKQLLEMGFYFTFGGAITYGSNYDDVIKFLPLDRILLETDAPYVAPAPHRGQRNEPLYVIEVAKKLAELKNLSLEEIAEITFKNSCEIFRL